MQPQSFLLISFSLASLTLTFLFNTGKANHLSWGSPWFSLSYSGNRSVISWKYLSLKEGGVRLWRAGLPGRGRCEQSCKSGMCEVYLRKKSHNLLGSWSSWKRDLEDEAREVGWSQDMEDLNLRGKGLFWCSFGIHRVFGIEHSDITESVWGRISLVDEL